MTTDSSTPAAWVQGRWLRTGMRLAAPISQSTLVASLILAWDVAFCGSFLLSFLFCPFWFLGSVLKNAVQRPGWTVAVIRIVIPIVTLAIALGNNELQLKGARANASRIINACNRFHADKGTYPSKLEDLVPAYLPAVPPAKHCLAFGTFFYFDLGAKHMLMWQVVPPYGRSIYTFEEAKWWSLD